MSEEKKHTAPEQREWPKEHSFDTPEGYFDDLTDRIMNKVEGQSSLSRKPIIHYLRPVIGLAASFLIIGLLLYVPLRIYMPDIWNNYYGQQQDDSLELSGEWEYIFADLEAVSYFADSEGYQDTDEAETTDDEFSDDELLDYLVAEVDDYDLVFAEL